MRRIRLTIALSLIAGAIILSVAIASAETWLAYAIIAAPNIFWTINSAHDPNAEELAELGVDRHLRVAVGPPPATLSVWVIEPQKTYANDHKQQQGQLKNTACVLLLHGIRDNKRSMLNWGIKLSRSGFRAVLVDLRGHGRSNGKFLTYGVVEAHDLSQLIDVLVNKGHALDRVGVLAPSYGGAVALHLAAIDQRVHAVVAAATFTSLNEILPVYVRRFFPSWLISDSKLKRALQKASRIASFDPYDANTKRAVEQTNARVLLIHSRTDKQIPYHHSQALYRAAGKNAHLMLLNEVDHNSILAHPKAKEASIAWLDRWLN